MKLERDLVTIDLETTGVDTKESRIVEICMKRRFATPEPYAETRTMRLNPGVPIPTTASDVHGITFDMVKDQPTFRQVAGAILGFIEGADILTFNGLSFDVPLLFNEFARAGINWDYKGVNFIDARRIFVIKEERTLTAAVKFYLGQDHTEAHSASADVDATEAVFFAQLEKYGLEDKTPAELAIMSNYDKPVLDVSGCFSTDADGDIIFSFGKNLGKKAKTEKSYLDWMINKGGFSMDTIYYAKKALQS